MVDYHDHSQGPTLFESDSEFGIEPERLVAVVPERTELEETTAPPVQSAVQSSDPEGEAGDPGLVVLVEHLAPNTRDLHFPPRIEPLNIVGSDGDTAMTEQAEAGEATETPDIQRGADRSEFSVKIPSELKGYTSGHGTSFDPHELREKASAGLREHEAAAQTRDYGAESVLEKRHDSHQEQESPLSRSKRLSSSRRGSPCLTVDTKREATEEESITTSPNLSKHVITKADNMPETLPAFQPHSPTKEGSASSPTLPPIHHIVTPQQFRPLDELAEAAATQQDARYARPHSQSFGSAASQSPILPYHPFPGHIQMSPSSQHAYSARSPTGGYEYGSPTQYAHPVAYYNDRRTSAPTDHPPPPPPSLPSVSSGESHGHASSADGYSTAHTTPIDVPDATPRPMLPPPPGMVTAPGYKCDFHGCQAPPFQTQYLLRFV